MVKPIELTKEAQKDGRLDLLFFFFACIQTTLNAWLFGL